MKLPSLTLLVLAVGCAEPKPREPEPPKAIATAPVEAPKPMATPSTSAAAPKLPLAELQKKTLRTMIMAFNAHDAKGLAAVYAANALVRSPSSDGYVEEQGRAAIEKGHAGLFAKSPDSAIATVSVLQKGDVVVWEWIATGSMPDAGGKPAKIGFKAASVLVFDADGLIKTDHTYFDRSTIAGQLGELPKGEKFRKVVEAPSGEGVWLAPKDESVEAKNVDHAKSVFAAYQKDDEKAFLSKIDDKTLHNDMTDGEAGAGGLGTNQGEFRAFRKAFPDATSIVEHAMGVGDMVAIETTTTATHKGPFGPFKPTNAKVTIHRLDVMDIRYGKVMNWTSYGNRREIVAPIEAAKGVATPAKKPPK